MKILLSITIVLYLIGCQNTIQENNQSFRSNDVFVTPESQGMNSNVLIEMIDLVEKENINVNSIVIARNNKTILDAHFYPNKKEFVHDVASVTKSITSAIVGIAIDNGKIESEYQRIVNFFPEYEELFNSEWKKKLTIKHLLSMSSGLCSDFSDGERQLNEMRLKKNSIEYILQQKLVTEPGSQFAYCSCATQLLSAIVQKATGKKMGDYGNTMLFEPLAIKKYIITSDKSGYHNGWGDSYWLSSDLLKIGQLYLQQGKWNGKQIISRDWIQKSSSEQIRLQNGEESYGYKWWIPNELEGLYEGRGRGNQRLVVYPKEQLVVIMTGTGFDPGQVGSFIIRSIESKDSIPENQYSYNKLQDKILKIQTQPNQKGNVFIPKLAEEIKDRDFIFEQNSFGLTHFKLISSDISNAKLILGLNISRSEEYGEREIPLGMEGIYKISRNTRFKTPMAAHAKWLSESEIEIDYNDFSSNHKYRINVNFNKGEVLWNMYDEAGFGETISLNAKIK